MSEGITMEAAAAIHRKAMAPLRWKKWRVEVRYEDREPMLVTVYAKNRDLALVGAGNRATVTGATTVDALRVAE